MTQFKRAYFFDSAADSTGDRFRTKNIPSEQTYANLLDSVGFLSEESDMATTTRQGFVVVVSDDDAIAKRDDSSVQYGKMTVLRPHQPPGVGVLDDVYYKESVPNTDGTSGTPVTGHGIKITGIKHIIPGVTRIGQQVELDLASVGNLIDESAAVGAKVPIITASGVQGLAPYGGSSSGSTTGSSYTHSQDAASNVWTVVHNLGYRPSVNVEVSESGSVYVVDAQVTYTDANNLVINLNHVRSGKAYLS